MKIRLMSDLHVSRYDEFKYHPLDEDIAIFAGDIANGASSIKWVSKQNIEVPTLVIPGNHEYYGEDFDKLNSMYDNCSDPLFLRNKQFIYKDVVFIGTTLWTDFALYGRPEYHGGQVVRALNDFFHIQRSNRLFSGNDSIDEYNQAICYLADIAYKKKKFSDTRKYVLITHHCPEFSVHPKYRGDPITPGFAVKVPQFVFDTFDLWCHGHTHSCFDYKVGNTRIVCNPRGYYGENSGLFNPNLILEI